MTAILSVSIESDDLDRDLQFWEAVLGTECTAVLTWAPGAASGFFELPDGVRLIISAPRRSENVAEWLGIELHVEDPALECARLKSCGVAVSEPYDTDGGSRAFVVTAPNGQKFRVGTRWPMPVGEADHTGSVPKERHLP